MRDVKGEALQQVLLAPKSMQKLEYFILESFSCLMHLIVHYISSIHTAIYDCLSGDREIGISTIPVVFGVEGAQLLMGLCEGLWKVLLLAGVGLSFVTGMTAGS